ncbi:MAG: SAF domain-containing protein [Pseudonocardia sp.]|nr:SAF domain-containing protein [Pseudonocardia sp.]
MRTTLPSRGPRGDAPHPAVPIGDGLGPDPWTSVPRPAAGGRRSVPHLLLGVLLVLACAVGALALTLQLGGSRPVLATARAVTVGQVLTAADLRQVSLPVDSDVRAVDAASVTSLVGRPVAVSLPAGALLTPESFGGADALPPGQAIVAVALDPGRLPREVASGDRVAVVAAPGPADGATGSTSGSGPAAPRSWPGVVTSVEPSDTGQLTVVSVQLPEGPAREVAAVPSGQVAVVLIAAGG